MAINLTSALPTTASSSTGQGILSSLGVGSGIDINSLISQLMTAEQAPLTLLQNQQSADQAQISAFGSVSSALSSLQTAAQALETSNSSSAFGAMIATPADTSVLTASTGTGAAAGSYNISVTSLASSQILRSNAAYSTTDTFNTGTLNISVGGGTATPVTIGSANNTLSGIAQAINSANAGVTATVLNDGTTNHLVLSSNTSGTAGAIQVSVSQTGTGATQNLTDFAYSGTDSTTMVTSQPAANASFKLNGTPITRSSNTVSDVINGVTLNLQTANASTTLSVAPDTSAVTTAVQNFVTAYNAAVNAISSVSAYDPTSNTAQPLTGNDVIFQLQSQLPSILSHGIAGIQGGLTSLADVGVTLQQDGTLALDSSKLQSALANPNNDVASLFGSSTANGYAYQIDQMLNNFVGPTGAISVETNGLTGSIQDLQQQESAMNNYLSQLQAQYTAEFTAMDSTVQQLNSTQSFMTQQLQYQLVNAGTALGGA
jgi:flagellar hook-associated protein 2